MSRNPLSQRRERYFALNSRLAQIDNAQLLALLGGTEASTGWGRNHTLEFGRAKVFVKRVPVTQVEYDHMFSTANLYDLPLYYNYGVGSAGLGVFRELVMHIKTTNWVLAGEIANFPMTYHYRIIPFSGQHGEVDQERHKGYIEYWGGNASISRYMLDRASAEYELILCLEQFPYTLEPWLCEHPDRVQRPLDDLRQTIDFLRKRGVIHFDAHLYNVLTDGERAYLTDFGLVLDRSFALSEEEQRFFRQHTHYDYGEVLASFGYFLMRAFGELPESEQQSVLAQCGAKGDVPGHEKMPLLLEHIEQLVESRMLKLDPAYVAMVRRYKSVMVLMDGFFSTLQRNHRKDTKFPHARLRQRLKETGFVPGTDAV